MTLDQYIQQFEQKMQNAMHEKYSGYPEEAKTHIIDQSLVMNQLDANSFLKKYKESAYFDESRVGALIDYFLDIKLQVFLIQEVHIGLYNTIIFKNGKTPDYQKSPYSLLKHLALDQGTIVKSRILWERIQNFVYYLETGLDLNDSKSKSKKFKKFLTEHPVWSFLDDYSTAIEKYDEILRTPEIHKKSKLRKLFIQGEPVDSEANLVIINIVLNIWQNIFTILEGKKPNTSHWNSGMGKLGTPVTDIEK
jgi:hypothetical protein